MKETVSIDNVNIETNPDFTRVCASEVTVQGRQFHAELTIPLAAYTRILSHVEKDVLQALFEAWIRQRADGRAFNGVLDEREVDGLFVDIRAKKRREAGGWANSAR